MTHARAYLLLAAFVIPGTLGGCSAKPEAKAQTSQPSASVKKVLSSSLDQIQNQYATDRAAAGRKYAGTAVQFTAVAASIAADAGNGTLITFTTAAHPDPIAAHFTNAASVTPGAIVQAKCDSIAVAAEKPELSGCSLRS